MVLLLSRVQYRDQDLGCASLRVTDDKRFIHEGDNKVYRILATYKFT
jgi:hypothetical protein